MEVLTDLSDRELLQAQTSKPLEHENRFTLLRRLRTSMALPDPRSSSCFRGSRAQSSLQSLQLHRHREVVSSVENGVNNDDDSNALEDKGKDVGEEKPPDSPGPNNPGIGSPNSPTIRRKSSLLRERSRVARNIVANSEESVKGENQQY